MNVNTAILHMSKAAAAVITFRNVFIISSSSLGAQDHIPLKQLCSLLHSPRSPIKACNKQRSTYTSKRVILPKVINA